MVYLMIPSKHEIEQVKIVDCRNSISFKLFSAVLLQEHYCKLLSYSMTLEQLPQHKTAVITALTHSDSALLSRIMALGIIPGEPIAIANVAPLGCPLQVKVGDTLVSVRKSDAQHIEIEII